MNYRALVVTEPGQPASFTDHELPRLADGEVTVETVWSSLNYKDALCVMAAAPIARHFPLVCGIDLFGRVVATRSDEFVVGDDVIVTGCGLGEKRDGGYGRFANVPAPCCVRRQPHFDGRQAMALGTAGLTATLAVQALEQFGSSPGEVGDLPVLVTGASGGVGSLAVALLATSGYRVTASTGRLEGQEYLAHLGATEVISRDELAGPVARLGHERFGAAIDVVGGRILANVIAQLRVGGSVAACGLAGGAELPTTVHPFILRGVNLLGINSVWVAPERRIVAWDRLAEQFPRELLKEITVLGELAQVPELAADLLAGKIRGRIVVEIDRV